MGFFDGGFGGVVSGVLGGLGGLAGGMMTNQFNSKEAQKDRDFQKEVYQNQIQWKSEDARKAGLHPLAAIGTGSYSASPSSIPSSDFSSSLGKLGEGIGDAFTAYMTKDQIAEQAARNEYWDNRTKENQNRLLSAQTEYYASMAMEAARRSLSYTTPTLSGSEVMPGQVDSPSKFMGVVNKFDWTRNPDGSFGDPIPSGDYKQAYEDVPFLEFVPHLDAAFAKWRSILSGSRLGGLRHNWRDNSWSR